MVDVLRCKGCQSALRMRPEYAGKKLRCPRCKETMRVPAAVTDDPPPLPNDDRTMEIPLPFVTPPTDRPAQRPTRIDTDEDADASEWKACPHCGAQESERVMWTFWGSFYGPALLNHVQCPECGTTYNGRTGRSNFIPALIFTLIPLLLIMGLVGVITWIILARQF